MIHDGIRKNTIGGYFEFSAILNNGIFFNGELWFELAKRGRSSISVEGNIRKNVKKYLYCCVNAILNNFRKSFSVGYICDF
jgi:hypothetical protein